MLSTMVKRMLYLPKQVIINKGDIEHNMYFIHKGIAEVHYFNNIIYLCTLSNLSLTDYLWNSIMLINGHIIYAPRV